MALKITVENVIVGHARNGLLVVIWRDGQVVEVLLEEVCEMAARILAE